MKLIPQTVYIPINENDLLPTDVYWEESSSLVALKIENLYILSKEELIKLLYMVHRKGERNYCAHSNATEADHQKINICKEQFINQILNQ